MTGPEDERDQSHPTFEALRERERLYRRLVELSPDMIVVQSHNRIVFVNSAGAQLLGQPAEELIGAPLLRFVHPESQDQLRDSLAATEASKEPSTLDAKLALESGELVDVEITAAALTFQNEPALQIIAREISEKRRASESLRISEERYRELFENANDIVYTHDLAGRFTSLNKAGEKVSGYTRDEALKLGVEDVLPPELVPLAHEMLARKITGEATATFYELEIVARDGKRVPVEVGTRLIHEKGKPVGVQGIARDITERKRAEAELKQSLSLLRSTLESTYDGMLVVDLSGNIVSFNRRFTEMWNFPPEELNKPVDQTTIGFISTMMKAPDAFIKRFHEIVAKPDIESFDVLEFRDGRVFERYSTPQMIDGKPVGRVWSFRDVSDRKHAEDALLASERRYRHLFERNLAGVYRNSLDGRILDCNDACARIFGYKSREDLLAQGAFDVYFDPALRQTLLERLKKEGAITNLEVRLRRSDGTPVWVLENMTLINDEDGNATCLEGTLFDITDRKIAEQKIEYHAYHDELTGLPNRVLFKDRLTIALGQARRFRRCIAVMFLDLDQFKFVNDTLGHSAGDQLLWGVGERLSNAVREQDTVARLGGDEFTLLLSELSGEDDAVIIAQKILQTIAQPFVLEGQELFLTTSIGIALYPSDGDDAETLLKNADSAMYQAKERGRNTYQLCTPEMNRRAMERMTVQKSLRRAFEREDFEVHYQPIVKLATGDLIGMEALVRWHHPDKGLVDAKEFIEIAEEMRLLLGIGEWVLQTACRQVRSWQELSLQPITVSVNLSTRQFHQRDILRTVERVLLSTGLDPRMLALEISESTAMSNVDLTLEAVRQARDIGVRVWMDDLGTGQSSLKHLKRFGLDRVKIDQSFVRDIPSDASDGAIVSAVIAMGHALGLKVIAEGVESQAQLEFLRAQECEEIQGHFVSRPLPPLEMQELLRRAEPNVVGRRA